VRFKSALYLLAPLVCCLTLTTQGQAQKPLKLLFLGDNGHHRPVVRFQELAPVLELKGIQLQYTDDVASALKRETLNAYDGLIVFANIDRIEPGQARALLDYVAAGKGFIPLHCASFCFRNSPDVVALIGAQFKMHQTGVVATELNETSHPVMQDFAGFSSWDETYVHAMHNEKDRVVLEYRVEGVQADGQQREPWTWVRTHGQGRVFYTAWGHDQRTWQHPGFHNLVERGIRWACGDDPTAAGPYVDSSRFTPPPLTARRTDVAAFEYVDVGPKVPNYLRTEKWGTQGEPHHTMQAPLPPEESIKHFRTSVGFEVRLFAAEPDLGGKPIAMNWDERGRLYVCETYDYPNELQPTGQGRDRIRICDDTDGDGRADRFTVFAENLSIPTAICCVRGGVLVQDGTQTLFLKDTDGDDKADLREVVITNWTVSDTHGGVSNFRYGLDNWIWAMQGYNNSTPMIDGQPTQTFRMGFFRFRLSESDPPRVKEIEFLRSTNNNTWGIGLSEEGLVFGSTANRNPSVFMPIPNRYYERVLGWSPEQLGSISDTHLFDPVTENVRQVDHHGGYTAGAGHAIYTAREYPAQWWNRTAFVCGPTGHLVGTFVLRPNGTGFQSTSPSNLIASDDEWSAPITAEVGPDGNVWVIDWYNYIVQHNPTPHGFEKGQGNAYISDLRDKKHGRVYRVVYVGDRAEAATAASPIKGLSQNSTDARNVRGESNQGRGFRIGTKLVDASTTELVKSLKHPTMLRRTQAQRLLVEQDRKEAVPELVRLVRDPAVDSIGLNVGVIHGLWTLAGLGALDGPQTGGFAAAVEALAHDSAGVRRNAVIVLPNCAESVAAILQRNLLQDSDSQVRLATALALSDVRANAPSGRALAAVVHDGSQLADRNMADALTSAAAIHATEFLAELARLIETSDVSASLDERTSEIVRAVAVHVARSKPSAETMTNLVSDVAIASRAMLTALLDGMAAGWPKEHRIALPLAADAALVKVMAKVPIESQSQLIRLARFWGSKELAAQGHIVAESLVKRLNSESSPSAEKLAAAQRLIEFRPEDSATVDQVLTLVSPQSPPQLASGAMEALVASRAADVGQKILEASGRATPAVRETALRVLLARPDTTDTLLDGVDAGQVDLAELSLDQQQALNNHPRLSLRRRARQLLRAGDGLPNPDRTRVVEEFLVVTEQIGSSAAGREVYKKHCGNCHRHGDIGEPIGPDLTGMAVHPKVELLTHILDPSRSVEGNFRLYTVVTADGRILNGMLASETRTSIELIDTEAKRHPIQRSDIEEVIASRKSVMPEGFEKQIQPEQLADLLEFLTAKGRFLPLDLRKVATIASDRGMFTNKNARRETLAFADWEPKVVEGVPFRLVDPQGGRVANVVLLHGPQGAFPPLMPTTVELPVNTAASSIHLLSGVSGWGHPLGSHGSVSLTVRLKYVDGATEDHELKNGIHFADYIRRVDVPESQFAYQLGGGQLRFLSIQPHRAETIERLDLIKGPDASAPVVMAVTVETK
jgi:hypothetical protein